MAIKLARAQTRRPKVISALGGYHGHTGLALAAGDEQWRAPFGPLAPGFVQAPFGDVEALEKEIDQETEAESFVDHPGHIRNRYSTRRFFQRSAPIMQ